MIRISELLYGGILKMKDINDKTKKDLKIFRELFCDYFEKYNGKLSVKGLCITLVFFAFSLFLLIINITGCEKFGVEKFRFNFEKIAILFLCLYIVALFLILMILVIYSYYSKCKTRYIRISDFFLKIFHPTLFFINFVQLNYNPKSNDNLFVSGVILIFINQISSFILFSYLMKYLIYKGTINVKSIIFLILIPTFLADLFCYIIYKKLLNFINIGYPEYNINKKIEPKNEEYSKKYLKNLVFRTQLVVLILLFFSIVFNPTENEELNSNFINAVSCISLAMLYLDKRKEWNLNENED